MIEFAAGERTANGYLALPEGRGPGVLVLHAWWGLTEVFTGVCDRLAAEGFVALAPDLYSGKRTDTIEGAQALASAMDGDATYETISGAIAFLRQHQAVEGEGLGTVGFSLGAAWALMLEEPIRAVVVFYGITDPASVTGNAPIQGHFASDDDYEPLEGVRAVEAAIRDSGHEVTFYVYEGTGHWFFEPNRPGYYNAQAAELAWGRTVAFLRDTIGRRDE
jgi:carboxymethylenebutenolidase